MKLITEPSCGNKQVLKIIYLNHFPEHRGHVLYQGCRGCCNANEKCINIYTNLNKKKTFSIISFTQRFKNCIHGIVGNEYLLESDYPRHPIVYFPTADFGENLGETQAKEGDLKPFAQRYFLIS